MNRTSVECSMHRLDGDRHHEEGCLSPNFLVGYCRLSATMTSLCSARQAFSSVDWMEPIRDARPGNLAGMHAIGRIFGQNNPGTDAGKREWLIRSVFKEEQVHAINCQ
jgi:hypothetical protein